MNNAVIQEVVNDNPSAASKPVPKPAPRPSAAQPTEEDRSTRNDPTVVTEGKWFVKGQHQMLAGWTVTQNDLGRFEVRGRVKNIGGDPSSALMEMKFLRGNEVVGTVQLSSDELEPGQTQKVTALGTDDFTKHYDRITVEAIF
jgi:hypothetical protein